MIRVNIKVDKKGYIKEIYASGHGGIGKKGSDILCSAVSVLLRSFAKVVYTSGTVKAEGKASERGSIYLLVKNVPEERIAWLRGMSTMVITGLTDLEREFPRNIRVNILRDIKIV